MNAMLRDALVLAFFLSLCGAASLHADDALGASRRSQPEAPRDQEFARGDETQAPAARPTVTAILASVDAAVARSVKAEAEQIKPESAERRRRPYLRNTLIGAAAGGLVMGIIGANIDENESGPASLSGYTGAYALGGAAIGAGIGALTAFIPVPGRHDSRP